MASRKKKEPVDDKPKVGDTPKSEMAAEDVSETDDTPEAEAPAVDASQMDDTPETEAAAAVTSETGDTPEAEVPTGDTPEELEAEAYDASSTAGPTVEAGAAQEPPSSVGGMLCHLSILCHFVAPVLSIVVLLVLWLVLKDEDPEVDHHGREALNLQLCAVLASLILGVTCLFAFLIPVLWLTACVFGILAAVEAHGGRRYRYPWIYRLIN